MAGFKVGEAFERPSRQRAYGWPISDTGSSVLSYVPRICWWPVGRSLLLPRRLGEFPPRYYTREPALTGGVRPGRKRRRLLAPVSTSRSNSQGIRPLPHRPDWRVRPASARRHSSHRHAQPRKRRRPAPPDLITVIQRRSRSRLTGIGMGLPVETWSLHFARQHALRVFPVYLLFNQMA